MGYKGVPAANAWHHIAVTFDGLVEKLYVDGKLNNQAQKNLYVNANNPIHIGWSTQRGGNEEFLTGSISSLKMYDYPLTATDITTLFNGNEVVTDVYLEETEKTNFAVYPNPSNNVFYIRNSENIASLKVVNVFGQTILTETENVGNQIVLGDEYADGAYTLVMYDKQGNSNVLRIAKVK